MGGLDDAGRMAMIAIVVVDLALASGLVAAVGLGIRAKTDAGWRPASRWVALAVALGALAPCAIGALGTEATEPEFTTESGAAVADSGLALQLGMVSTLWVGVTIGAVGLGWWIAKPDQGR
jgi:hypothetical protein